MLYYYYMVKIFTMVKGEIDIVTDWVLYHGSIFGYSNLYIIDNFSQDGTYDVLVNLKKKYGIHIFRCKDYKKKGEYMTLFLKTFSKNEFSFPIDIDEFIVLYDKSSNEISCDSNKIHTYIRSLPRSNAYKMHFIWSKNFIPDGYNRAVIDCNFGAYQDNNVGAYHYTEQRAKTFFHSSLFKGTIDHGNHYPTNDYFLTKLCLVHYHCRNLEQMKKKVYNNVYGLGYHPFNVNNLKNIIMKNPKIQGNQHINNQINILQKKYNIPIDTPNKTDIVLKPISEIILSIN